MGKQVPVGMERILYLAATDASFFQALLQDREAATATLGLRPSERAVLLAVPENQLRAAILGVDVSAGNLARRAFMGAVAASAATVAAATTLGCGDDVSKGIRPDMPPSARDGGGKDTVEVKETGPAPTGIRPGGG